MQIQAVLDDWGTARFRPHFRRFLRDLDAELMPLQQGLQHSSMAITDNIDVMILSESEASSCFLIKIAVFYQGVVAGCNCSDDPTPVVKENEYCELLCKVHKNTSDMSFKLLSD